MESFEELIAKEKILKKIKRCYLTKTIESFNIEKSKYITVYNNDIKSSGIKFNKDDVPYFFEYKIKRRRNKCVLKNNNKLKITNNTNNTDNIDNSDNFNELTEEETTLTCP